MKTTGQQERPKLAVYLPDLSGGGAERSIINIAAGLAGRNYDVDLVVATGVGPYLDQLPPNVRFVDLKAGMPRKSVFLLAQYLRRERPTALMSALDNANVVAIMARALARTSTRIVISSRNQTSSDYQQPGMRMKLHLIMVRLTYKYADHIVAVSRGVADDLADFIGLPRQRVGVIYNPVVSEELLEKARQPVDHPWFAAGQPPVILSAGRLTVQKDQAMLLRAFAKVRASMPARLMILGEGTQRPALETLARELNIEDDFALPGFEENPFAYMNKAAVFALSSKYEGLPGVLIQAMASGCSVVSTDCPSGPDEILEGGKFGALVPVGDADALAEALLCVLKGNGKPPAPPEALAPFQTEHVMDQIVDTLLH